MSNIKFLILLLFLGFLSSLLSSCSKSEAEDILPPLPEEPLPPVTEEKLDTIDYRAWIWVEKADLERYGGERIFKNKLIKFFRHTTLFWNESKNKFSHYYRFVPSEELKIYDTNGNQDRYNEFKNQAYGAMDTEKHDFVVFFALNAKNAGLSCGGGGKSGQSVVMCYQPASHDIFQKEFPDKGTYSDMGHEYGHVRGAIDLYQHIIEAKDNPVTNTKLFPDKCNMGTGFFEWSDYCSALFNYNAYQKQLDPQLNNKTFPSKMQLTVMRNGVEERSVDVKFYGTRAGGSSNNRDVYPRPFRQYRTNSSGKIEIPNVKDFFFADPKDPNVPFAYGDDWPYWRWFGFVVVATAIDGSTNWIWLQDYKIQEYYLRTKEEIYPVVINLNSK